MKIKQIKVLFVSIIVVALTFVIGCGNKPRVIISKAERSPEITGNPKVRIVNIIRKGNGISVELGVDNFVLGSQTQTPRAAKIANSPKGQHVHLILDNKPYAAVYKQGKGNLVHIEKVAMGQHTLFAFPSRSYHESVKTPGASSMVNFELTDNKLEFLTVKMGMPSIIYSRPKGTYKGDAAKKIMLDFYLNNLELSADGNTARYKIHKESETREHIFDLNEWTPVFVSGLSDGKYFITLELLDKDGNLVQGKWNNTTREIVVSK